ncbi:vWA domain-containing protein [Micromonospora sp. LZ34]
MTNSVPLIQNQTPVQRGFRPEPNRDPSVAAVYATASGELVFFSGRTLSFSQRLFTECRTRYDVDMGDHRRTAELASTPLRTRDGHYFIAKVNVGFRVHDPCEVVRRNIRDALPVVYTYLGRALEAVTTRFDVENPSAAEQAIRREFANPVPLPDGITIFEVAPHLRPDDATAEYLRTRRDARRTLDTDADQHRVELQRERHRAEREGLVQASRLNALENERHALGGRGLTAADMAREHLIRHPEDTEKVTSMLLEHERAMLTAQDVHSQRTTEFIKFMMDNGVVQPGQFQPFVQGAAQAYGLSGAAGAVTGPGTWNQPPVLPPSGGAGSSTPATPAGPPPREQVVLEQDPNTKVWVPSDGVQPVYLLVDESTGAAPYLDDLGDGLQRLLDGLRRAADVAPAIRLSVLGYADQVAARLSMAAVDAATSVPWLTSRGPASYANAFETLYGRISPDVDALKAQGITVRRPLVFLLAAAPPADESIWQTPYARLTDPATHRYAPQIVACGVGGATAGLIAAIATKPEFGYVATAGADVRTAIADYWDALTRCLVTYGRTLLAGAPDLEFELPPHFRVAVAS